jgi:hypothetical protein
MSYQWMPIIGEFDTSANRIVFKGHLISPPESGQPQPQQQPMGSVGILLSDHKMVSGSLRATVEFAEVTSFSVCEIIISYDHQTKSMITAGLGGGGGSAMFSIRQWFPPNPSQSVGAWTPYELSGDRVNLRHRVK